MYAEEGHKILEFESLVNSDRCKINPYLKFRRILFESLVNSDRCKMKSQRASMTAEFESLVNSDRCKILWRSGNEKKCLRALLIQIGAKSHNAASRPGKV